MEQLESCWTLEYPLELCAFREIHSLKMKFSSVFFGVLTAQWLREYESERHT